MSDDTTIDGVDDTTDAPKTYTQAEVDEMTKGLKDSRDTLLTEKKQASTAAKEAEAARILAEQSAAKQAGSMEQLEKSVREQKDAEYGPLVKEFEALKNRSLISEKKAVLGSFSGDFIAAESIDLIGQLVKTEFDGENVKTQYTDFSGNVITTDAAEFKKWMGNHPAISHLMKADAANGGGATGGKQVSGGAMNMQNVAAEAAKSKGDAIGTLNERLKGQFKL